jgi:hypothetical protein
MSLNDISNALKCKQCLNVFVEPKTLECGETICSKCLNKCLLHNKDINNNSNDYFICSQCNSKHHLPKDSIFKTNHLINKLVLLSKETTTNEPKLLKTKSDSNLLQKSTTTSKETLQLQQLIEQIQKNIENLNKQFNLSRSNVQEHCTCIRNEINYAGERRIEAIKVSQLNLIAQIDQYEMNCLSSMEQKSDFKNNFDQLLNESIHYCHEWSLVLRQNTPNNTTTIGKGLLIGNDLQKCLNNKKIQLYSFIFNGQFVLFKENLSNLDSNVFKRSTSTSSSSCFDINNDTSSLPLINENEMINIEPNPSLIGHLVYYIENYPMFKYWRQIDLNKKLFLKTSYTTSQLVEIKPPIVIDSFTDGKFFCCFDCTKSLHLKDIDATLYCPRKSKLKIVLIDKDGNFLASKSHDIFRTFFFVAKLVFVIV